MAWPLTHHDLAGTSPPEGLDGARDYDRVRVDHRSSFVLNQIGLQQNPTTANMRVQKIQAAHDSIDHPGGVV